MGLRNILLFISIIIIGFCLSLYFQTSQSVQSVNWEQYKNMEFTAERSLSLADLDSKIVPNRIEDIIQEMLEKNRLAGEKTRVMEISPGNGRVLMELKKMFPDVEFYGINKEKSHSFYRRESFILTALKFGIMTKEELEGIELPYVVFQDLDFGESIPYDDNKFDLIYSQDAIPLFKYKFELFNEIMRVLKPGGVSFHTNVSGMNIYSKGLVLELRDALAEIRRRGIDINTLENRTSIRFRKGFTNRHFPVEPHQAIPDNTLSIPQELRRPEMGYNITF
jgi:SAM-dependent methyltransferase